jgi:hypothetical protein
MTPVLCPYTSCFLPGFSLRSNVSALTVADQRYVCCAPVADHAAQERALPVPHARLGYVMSLEVRYSLQI